MMDAADKTKPNVGVLDYQTPRPRPRLGPIQYLIHIGPRWILPSWKSLVLLALLAGAIMGLRHRPLAWKMGGSYQITDINRPSFWSDYVHEFQPMPAHDAVFCIDGAGHPCVWPPWDNHVLVRLAAANSPIEWLGVSGDESILMTGCNTDIFLWDAGNGKLLRQLTVGTRPDQIAVDLQGYGLSGAALSRNGSRLVTLGRQGELTLWEVTGPAPRKLAYGLIGNSVGMPMMEFSPDDSRLLVQVNVTAVSIFDAQTLASLLTTSIAFNGAGGRVFQWLDGGRKLVVADQNGANATSSKIQVFDCQNGQPLASWSW